MITRVSFSGFYNSIWSQEFDQIEEREAEFQAENQDDVPKPLRLTASEFSSILFDVSDYGAMYSAAARHICDAYNFKASEIVGFPLRLVFESMTSPREYNFETDKLWARIPDESVLRLFAMSEAEGHTRLAATIRDRFTSRSGFISFYSNNLESWLDAPVTDWDHNQLWTLLDAIVGEIDEYQLYCLLCDELLWSCWSDGVNWPKFDAMVEDAREDKREDLGDELVNIRCQFTRDLFDGYMG